MHERVEGPLNILPASHILDFSEVPVIDVAPLGNGDRAAIARTVAALARACQDVGFMYIRNHGVPTAALDEVVRQCAKFFALPVDQKLDVAVKKSPQFRGYLPLQYAGTDDATIGKSVNMQEAFIIMHDRPRCTVPLHGPNQWPAALPSLRPAMEAYFAETERLAHRLLPAFAMALGLSADFFAPYFTTPMMMLKLNHYPPQPPTDDKTGVVAHSDGGGFTILWQDHQGGLEIKNKSGEWVGVPPIPGTYVINIGDTMQMWANGRFSSTAHRVINISGNDRYSIPLFVNPNYDAVITPIVDHDRRQAQPVMSGKYMESIYRRIYPQ